MKPKGVFITRIFESRGSRVLFPGFVLALFLIACSPTPAGTPAATPTSADAKSAIVQAIRAHLTAGPYRVVSNVVTGSSTIAEHGEVILPDRFHLIANISGGPDREYLIIGSATFAKIGGVWSPLAVDLSSLLAAFVNNLDPATISNARLVGPEVVNGTPTLAYTFTYTDTISGSLITTNDEMWVSVASGLPVKQTVDGVVSGSSYHSEQTIEYDSTITIEAPPTP